MAKPDLRPLYSTPETTIMEQGGKGFKAIDLGESLNLLPPPERQILKRTGSLFVANTPLDLTDPGPGWSIFGSITDIEDEEDLLLNTKIYRNGQLLTGKVGISSVDFDFYFIEKNKIAFIFSVRTSEVIQCY